MLGALSVSYDVGDEVPADFSSKRQAAYDGCVEEPAELIRAQEHTRCCSSVAALLQLLHRKGA